MENPKQRSASKAKAEDMNPKPPRENSVGKTNPEKQKGDPSDPMKKDKAQGEQVRPGALPRYDDQPKKTRGGDAQTGSTDLPDYGDRESGDPRQIEIRD
jgi:hypothetical protein